MIDLHLHSTASDGALRPAELVARVAAASVTTLSLTDHDTTGGLAEARDEADRRGLRFIDGIEITAIEADRDVHVLGYFIDPSNRALLDFLARQQQDRIRRVREMAERLTGLGVHIDPDPLIARGLEEGRSVGRPHVAAALIAGGYVDTWDEAFAKYLEHGRPAFVARRGASAAEVIGTIGRAGGVTSLAHPGLSRIDSMIPSLAVAGLDALEARHAEHDPETETRYREVARSLGLAVSGGSDFHDDSGRRRDALGRVTLTEADFAALESRRR